MATLETQYQKYREENPESDLSYEQWVSQRFSAPPDVSDNFQIGPQGAFEYDDSEINDWNVTLQDGLQDFPWDNEE